MIYIVGILAFFGGAMFSRCGCECHDEEDDEDDDDDVIAVEG